MNRLTRPHHAIPGLSALHRPAKTVCVPLVATQGESFRLTEATTGKGVMPLR
ncbi:hypothetical protein [Streptomyces phaeochromogenes]